MNIHILVFITVSVIGEDFQKSNIFCMLFLSQTEFVHLRCGLLRANNPAMFSIIAELVKLRKQSEKFVFFFTFQLMTIASSSIVVNHKEIVVQKGEEIVLKCSTSQTEALGCVFKSPAEHGYNMLRGAAYEDGRIQQKELNPNDCAIKITNIRQSDNGAWHCNVTAKDTNNQYDIGEGKINVIVAIKPVEVSMKIDENFITGT